MFAEVFFDNVRVPVANRLGDEGQGWKVTVSAGTRASRLSSRIQYASAAGVTTVTRQP